MSVKSTYYGMYGEEYIRNKAAAEMHADAMEDVFNRQREADRQEYERREANRRRYEYEHSEEYRERQRQYRQSCRNWDSANAEMWTALQNAQLPNLPDNAQEAQEVLDYYQAHGVYPAPYQLDREMNNIYQQIIYLRLHGRDNEVPRCITTLDMRWKALLGTAFCVITDCPYDTTRRNVVTYMRGLIHMHGIGLTDFGNWIDRTAPQRRSSSPYANRHLPISDELLHQSDPAEQRRRDVHNNLVRQLTHIYEYLSQNNPELQLTDYFD